MPKHVKFSVAFPSELIDRVMVWMEKFEKEQGVSLSRNAALIALLQKALKEDKG